MLADIDMQDENQPPNDQIETEETAGELQKKKLTLAFEDYRNISNMLVLHMRAEERKMDSGESDSEGVRREDLINWYLEQVGDDIESEDDLIERKTLVEKVIDRLMNHDQVIIPLRTTILKPKQNDADEEDSNPVLVVHPNYVIE